MKLKPPPLSAFFCWNGKCPKHGQRDSGNIRVDGWSDRKKTIRRLACRECGGRWSERKGTVLYNSRAGIDKIASIAQHLAEGIGIRPTSRLTGARQKTVIRYNRLLGQHGKALHDEGVRGLRVREAQGDELWSFVGKKRQAVPKG